MPKMEHQDWRACDSTGALYILLSIVILHVLRLKSSTDSDNTSVIYFFSDVNETSVEQKESNSDDEEPKLKIVCSAPSTSQRVSTFPGVNPAALIVCFTQ